MSCAEDPASDRCRVPILAGALGFAAIACLMASGAHAQEHWSGLLPEIGPALRACLGEDERAMVVDAWLVDRGLVAARILRADGKREDCVAQHNGNAVLRRAPVEDGDRRPAEGERAFMLERRCVDARRIEGEGRAILGWLAYPACR